MSRARRNRPGVGTEAATDLSARSAHILQALDRAGAVLDTGLVLMVETEGPTGRILRRAYVSLASAEKAVRLAEDRGAEVRVTLCRLQPLSGDAQ